MSIAHHPSDALLAAFAAGTLDHGQHVAVATHLVSCAHCRSFVRSLEEVGGAMIESLSPAPMSEDVLARTEALLGTPVGPGSRQVALPAAETGIPGLPGFLRRYQFGKWQWIAPSVHLRAIKLPYESATRVFLLKSGPGTRMLQHTHTGVEMTCVLAGGFSQANAHFGPGDFDFGDETIDHQPVVDLGEDCVCLVAMQGDLSLKGVIGRIVQPFIRL